MREDLRSPDRPRKVWVCIRLLCRQTGIPIEIGRAIHGMVPGEEKAGARVQDCEFYGFREGMQRAQEKKERQTRERKQFHASAKAAEPLHRTLGFATQEAMEAQTRMEEQAMLAFSLKRKAESVPEYIAFGFASEGTYLRAKRNAMLHLQ